MIQYRKATILDVDQLALMRVDMICENPGCPKRLMHELRVNTQDYMAKGLAEDNLCLWLAEENDKPVAMSSLNYFFLPPNDRCVSGKTAYIGNMYTLPNYRRQGIAKKLLALNVEEARKHKAERVILNPTEVGRTLYEPFGFVPWSDALVLYPLKGSGSACGRPNERYGKLPV